MVKLRPLTEAQCYARCYGEAGLGDTVRVIRAERQPRGGARVLGRSP